MKTLVAVRKLSQLKIIQHTKIFSNTASIQIVIRMAITSVDGAVGATIAGVEVLFTRLVSMVDSILRIVTEKKNLITETISFALCKIYHCYGIIRLW